MENPQFSETLKAILIFSKGLDAEFSFDSVSKMLAPLYSENMRIADTLTVLHRAMCEVLEEPRFQRMSAREEYFDLMLAPVKGHFKLGDNFFSPKLDEKYSIEEYMNCILQHMMSFFRMTNVGWCRNFLFAPSIQAQDR